VPPIHVGVRVRIVIIGGSGHVGTYLVPMLVGAGHHVVNVSRGRAEPYLPNSAWNEVETVVADRPAEEASGAFGARIAALRPEVVIDMISFTLPSTNQLVQALWGRIEHFLHCGTIWVYGHNPAVPATEADPLNAFGEYGTGKAAIEDWLLSEAKLGFPATVFRPGHIVGPGWPPLNPAGHFNTEVFAQIRRGDELVLPNFGLETVHHVHAEDVAQVAFKALGKRDTAIGQTFNTVSAQALNLRGYAEAMFRWFGNEPRLRYQPFDEWKLHQRAQDAEATWEHIVRSPAHSIEKARTKLGYEPKWSSLDAVKQSVSWLIENGKVA
jgi:nucleoside-diphosphate-sugar epimerase